MQTRNDPWEAVRSALGAPPASNVIDVSLLFPRTPQEVYVALTALETPPPARPPGGERMPLRIVQAA